MLSNHLYFSYITFISLHTAHIQINPSNAAIADCTLAIKIEKECFVTVCTSYTVVVLKEWCEVMLQMKLSFQLLRLIYLKITFINPHSTYDAPHVEQIRCCYDTYIYITTTMMNLSVFHVKQLALPEMYSAFISVGMLDAKIVQNIHSAGNAIGVQWVTLHFHCFLHWEIKTS